MHSERLHHSDRLSDWEVTGDTFRSRERFYYHGELSSHLSADT
jgi:hypothetical protein